MADLEEGEIDSSEELENETTRADTEAVTTARFLPRPSRPVMPDSDSEDDESDKYQSDDSESDGISGPPLQQKRLRKEKPMMTEEIFENPLLKLMDAAAEESKKRRVNNVWGSVLNEQSITEDLSGVGVKKKQNKISRDVESYSYNPGDEICLDQAASLEFDETPNPVAHDPFELVVEENTKSDSAKIDDVVIEKTTKKKSIKERLGSRDLKRKHEPPKERLGYKGYDKNKCRAHIQAKYTDPVERVIEEIVQKLNEPKSFMIERVVSTIGAEKSLKTLYATEDIESAGGLMTVDGSRRRTPGGVYLQLIKNDPELSKEQNEQIFQEDAKNRKQIQRRRKIAKRKHIQDDFESLRRDIEQAKKERQKEIDSEKMEDGKELEKGDQMSEENDCTHLKLIRESPPLDMDSGVMEEGEVC